MSQAEALRSRLLGLGFDAVRFTSADKLEGHGLRRWLDAGHQGAMEWMARNVEKRLDPANVLPETRSLILLGVNYRPAVESMRDDRARWARYSLYEDYHDTINPALVEAGKILEAELGLGPNDYRYYVDTGPVLEREWSARAGLGYVGKNAMLISREFGNWLFLSAILVRAELPADQPVSRNTGVGALCGKCTRCLEACPTDAFVGPGWLDARRCISYLTIENKGAIPREFRRAIGNRIYGCDICAEVCPWNRFSQEAKAILLRGRGDLADVSLAELLSLDAEGFARVFRRTPIKRIKLTGLLRNACVVAANLRAMECLPALIRLASHDSVLVRAHAVWAIRELVPNEWRSLLAERLVQETEPLVREELDAVA